MHLFTPAFPVQEHNLVHPTQHHHPVHLSKEFYPNKIVYNHRPLNKDFKTILVIIKEIFLRVNQVHFKRAPRTRFNFLRRVKVGFNQEPIVTSKVYSHP